MKKNINTENKGITLVALVITIIILLILAGITINSLTGSGLFEKTKLAKEKSENAEKLENERLEEYGEAINGYIDGSNRDTKKSGYNVTLIWEDNGVQGNTITLTNGHRFDEFDTIRFRIIDTSNEWWGREEEISIETINELIEGNKRIGLYGYDTNHVSLRTFTQNSFVIDSANAYKLYKIYGVNY